MTPSQGQDLQEGVYRTPMDLLRPINERWPLHFDLAANDANDAILRLRGHSAHYGEDNNALEQPWGPDEVALAPRRGHPGYCWLNPPYGDIGAWTAKAETEAAGGAKLVMLLPAATGASWLRPCREKAQIVFLVGRPVFEFLQSKDAKPDKQGKIRYRKGDPNTDPYPKDLLLAVFGQGTGVSWWDWRK